MKLAASRVVTVLASILALAALLPHARADSITYHVALDVNTQPGFVPFFDPSLGTLTEVILSASGSASGLIDVSPELISSGTYSQTVGILFVPPGNGPIDLGSQTQFVDFSLGTPSPLIQTGTPFSFTSETLTGLDRFQGTDQANIQITVSWTLVSPPVLHQSSDIVGATGQASLTYVYSVPEPPALTMGVTSVFVGLGFWLFRRSRPLSAG